jgi:hypothetical protein
VGLFNMPVLVGATLNEASGPVAAEARLGIVIAEE